MSTIARVIVLESDGISGILADGDLINAGGTTFPTFTVGGRGLLFDDGSSTSGSLAALTLNQTYLNSPAVAGTARIDLVLGKDFSIFGQSGTNLFKIDAETGKITIGGDLEILGTSTVIDTIVQDSDHWLISPKTGTTTVLKIQPDPGVIPLADIISVRRVYGGLPVLRLDKDGNLILSQNLTVNGLINDVDVAALKSDFDKHLAGDSGFRHLADDVDILPIAELPGASNVQQALEQINSKIETGVSGGGCQGYEHIQNVEQQTWNIIHNKSTLRVSVTIYDENLEMILPDMIKIINSNAVDIHFSSPISGRAILILF